MKENENIVLERYKVVRKLGRGPATEAYEAYTVGAAGVIKTHCIKRILPPFSRDRNFLKLFARDTRASMALQHGNIAQTYDLGKTAGDIYIASEYVDGRNLDEIHEKFAKQEHRFPVILAVHIAREICRGLEHAHTYKTARDGAAYLVHGGISPDSVIVSYEGQVKIVDFGTDKALRAASNGQNIPGRFSFSAPEQLKSDHDDPRADIYSTGALLFWMLSGVAPHQASTISERLEEEDSADLSLEAPWLDSDIIRIVEKAMAKEASDRFPGAYAFEETLAQYLHHNSDQAPSEDDVGSLMNLLFSEELALEGRSRESRVDAAAFFGIGPSPPEKELKSSFMIPAIAGAAAIFILITGIMLGFIFRGTEESLREVTVRSVPPGARISIDGTLSGMSTDGKLRDLEAGRSYEITVSLPGYEEKKKILRPDEDLIVFNLNRERKAFVHSEKDSRELQRLRRRREPVRITDDNGRRKAVLNRYSSYFRRNDLPGLWLNLDPSHPHVLEVSGEILITLVRNIERLVWLAFDENNKLKYSGTIDFGIPAHIPAGAESLMLMRLQGSLCDMNVGDARVVLRQQRKVVERTVINGRSHCLGITDKVGTIITDLLSEEGLRIIYEGPGEGPEVFSAVTSVNPMALSRPNDEGLEKMKPGDSITVYYPGTLYLITFEEPYDEDEMELIFYLEPVGPP